MMKQAEMIALVCDLCLSAYDAGFNHGVPATRAMRCERDRLLDAISDLYKEIDDMQDIIKVSMEEISMLRDDLEDEKKISARKEDLLDKLLGPDPDDIAPDDMEPDDMEPELRDCMPHPDVEDLAPASELLEVMSDV